MSNVFTWTDFYQELADKVLSYKADRKPLIKEIEAVYRDAGIEYKLFWDGHFFTDIDPFTFFGTINKGIADRNRKELLRQYRQGI